MRTIYDNVDVFMMVDENSLPHFVEDALKNLAIPFAVIRNKEIIAGMTKNMKTKGEEKYEAKEVVFTFKYSTNEFKC
jgi:hypothetical protein